MDMATFYIIHKIKGKKIKFRVFQRTNGNWNIEFKRGQKRSLKTKDKEIAKTRAEISVEKYFEQKIFAIKNARKKTLSKYFENFLSDKDFDSIKTEKNYRVAIELFIDFIGNKNMRLYRNKDIKEFKTLHRAKRLDKRKGKVSKISINSYLRHIKAVFRKAKEDGVIASVPKIEFYKIDEKLPVILTDDDKKKVLKYIKKEDSRFFQVCQFALFTGCRRSEIISARWENFRGFTIKVIGKGNKERTVPLVPKAKKVMGSSKKEGPIFWQAHPDTYTHYFKKYARAAGVYGVSFHKMRHTAATSMLEAGVNINVVQKVLGHTDIATTKIYAHVMEKFLLKEMEKFGNL
jgi:integrase